MNKTIVVFNPGQLSSEVWLPALWSQAKTYYEHHGKKVSNWTWAPCFADIHSNDYNKIKEILEYNKPDVFAVSLYVWNYGIGHEIAQWVKQRWPNCFVITGGPHQYFKHDVRWFADHAHIDASLPGDSYGELCIQEILDNIDIDGTIDYNTVTNLCYPYGKSRLPKYSIKQTSTKTKKNFDYSWPSFAEQKNHIDQFVVYAKSNNQNCKLLSIIETTRGCPYGCTYCDWGGGINTAVIKKNVNSVYQDIELLCSYDLTYLYLADANFGIFGDRDVEIMKKLIKYNQKFKHNIKLGYGGFAKTENKIDYVKEILTLDIKNHLSNSKEIKLSMQTLDVEILNNINRKNIKLELQLKKFQPLANNSKLPIYIEMILGLPGMTLEKFYHELNTLGKHNLSVMWYEWLLLPEAPAYHREYQAQFGIHSVVKTNGWAWPENRSERNVVVETNSYTRYDYLEMLLATSLYHSFIQGGLYQDSIKWIQQNHKIEIGDAIKRIYKHLPDKEKLMHQWQNILDNPAHACHFQLPNNRTVYIGFYYAMLAFSDSENFLTHLENCLAHEFACPKKILQLDRCRTITSHNTINDRFDSVLEQFANYKNSQKILRTRRKLFGIF